MNDVVSIPDIGPFDDLDFEKTRRSLNSKINVAACDYWNQIRQQGRLPMRRDLNPAEIPRILPSVLLLDVMRPELDFRYRLVGTRWVNHFGRDDTGRLMSDIDHQRAPSLVWTAAEHVVRTGMPTVPELPYVGALFGSREIEVLISPLSQTGETIDILFVTVDFRD